MFEGDFVSRAALYPKFLSQSDVFDEETLLNPTQSEDGNTYAISVASRFLAKSIDGMHAYGCHAASLSNERFTHKNGRQPTPIEEEVHYLGFYDLRYGDIISIQMEYYDVACRWVPEKGADLHFEIQFVQTPTESTKNKRRGDRRQAVGILATFLRGPERYIAPQDEVHREILSAIELPQLPRMAA